MNSVWVLALAYPVTIALLFWLAFLRPVQQHQKKQREELANLRVGDEVLTQAGFIARIKEIRVPEEHGPTEILLDLGEVTVRATAAAVVQRLQPAAEREALAQGERAESVPAPNHEQLNVEQAQGSPNA
jgi:preprotein translocase YajC subunit